MTPEERAGKVYLPFVTSEDDGEWHDQIWGDIADAIRAAVAAEREACAKLADGEWDGWGQKGDKAQVAARVAELIRARGTSGAPRGAPGKREDDLA